MIRSKHKIISVVLCVTLVLCAFCALTFTAHAASGDTIYVRLNNGWSQVYCYMWTDNAGNNGNWPGVAMTATGESGVYTYKVTGDFAKIIFNNGSGGSGNQTADLTYTGNGGDGKLYDLKSGTWSQYTQPTTVDNPTTPTTPTTPPSDGITVYLKNTKGWSAPHCYMWKGAGGAGNQNTSWAGDPMTLYSDDIWVYNANDAYEKVIFSNTKSGNDKTDDLTAMDGYVYDPTANTWEPFDLSPLQVKSVSADPNGTVYTGTEITLTADAVSTEGTVKYKFSANDTVVRDWAASNTATWTPTAAGTYTITFDFKDSKNNTKSRTLTLNVQADTNVSNPIIKKVTPGEGGYVKTGSNNTISVTAGGGKTGTNLLFYKYVIEDSTGKRINTAYYTLNSSYTFKPATDGAYKIIVTVQASDNTEASRTVNVNASATAPTEPTEPTDPPTQPTDPTNPTDPEQYALGDVNKDGKVNIKDATYLACFITEYNGFEVTLELGDVNKDGYITVKDVTEIQRIAAAIV